MISGLRDTAASLLRACPHFRGKARIGQALARAFRAAEGHEPLKTVPLADGTRMLLDVRSEMQQGAFWTGEYDHDILRRLRAMLRPGSVVLDVGANVGFYSVALGHRLRQLGGGAVYAFEPVRANYDRLTQNVALNGLQEVVRTHRLALGDSTGEIEMYTGWEGMEPTANAVMLSSGVPAFIQENWPENRRVETASCRPLDELAVEQGIAGCRLVKLDIEGAEVLFLRGASAFIQRHRPVVFGEFNAVWMQQFGHSYLDVAELAEQWAYRQYALAGPGRFREIPEPRAGIEHVLLIPKEAPAETLRELGAV